MAHPVKSKGTDMQEEYCYMYVYLVLIEETVKGCAGCNTKHLSYSSEQMRNKQIDRLQTKPLKPISVMLNITTKYALTLLNPKKKIAEKIKKKYSHNDILVILLLARHLILDLLPQIESPPLECAGFQARINSNKICGQARFRNF